MTGTVEHMSLSEARRDISSSQSRLSAFGADGETTYIGIVNSDDGDISDVADEMRPSLSPPDDLFYQWLQTKKRYENDGAVNSVQAHNQALDAVDYRPRFRDHLETDAAARDALEELATRVESGEHIVFVCYCNDNKWCHREPVTETIKSMVDERIDV